MNPAIFHVLSIKMPRFSPFRLLISAILPLTAAAQLPSPPASTIPPSQPTTQAPPPPAQPAPDQSSHRAQVTWTNGQLSVTADNSSLNQILREISRQTGMKITGGVRDERVFGTYGPAETGTVLVSLLTGTGSNMLLKEARNDTPLELVLTPRQGGPTPPSPASFQRDDDSDRADLPQRFNQRERPPMPVPPPTNIQSASQIQSDQNQQPATTPSDSQSTGVRTPQQIYDQLMKLQQQKAATPPQN